MALARYCTLTIEDLGRLKALVAHRKDRAEKTAFRTVRSWLLNHLEEPEGSTLERSAEEMLEELEAYWESTAVDGYVEDWALELAKDEYLDLQGAFDGKKHSDRVMKARLAKGNRRRHALVTRGKLFLEADEVDGDHFVLKRFERF